MARIRYIPNRVIDTNGISDGSAIGVYQTGTLTPVSIYADAAFTVPLSNPYTVNAGAAVPEIFADSDPSDLRVRVVADGGAVISDDDPFDPVANATDLKAYTDQRRSVADEASLSDAVALGVPVLFNAGTRTIQATEALVAGTQLYGDGETLTETTVQATGALPSVYGFTVVSDTALSDQSIILDKNGQTWAAGVGFASAASNIRLSRVKFTSAGAADGAYALFISNAAVSDVMADSLLFDGIALPQIKDNADTSVQTRWSFPNYRATGCVDGFNINTPAGEWSHGYIDGWVDGSTQFGYAFAGPGCFGWRGTLAGADNDYEMVHIEDAASRMHFHVIGERNNLEPGTPGSPSSAVGAVSILGGSNAIDLSLDLDLTQNIGGSPVGVAIQAGSARVSDGLIVDPFNIKVGGFVKGGNGRSAVIAIEARDRIVLDNLSVESETGDVMDPCLSIPGSNVTGTLAIKTPGVIIEANDNTPMTGLDRLILSDVTSDFTDWADGTTTDRTAVQVAQLLKLTRAFTADVSATWQPIMPVFRDCRVRAAWKFQENGAANGALVMCDEFIIESGALVPRPVVVRAGGTSDPVPGHAAPVTPTGDTTNGWAILTNLSAVTGILPGHNVSGTGIASGTKVVAVLSGTSIAIDKAATATGAGVTLTIRTPPTSDLCWRVNSGMLECHIYNGSTANGTLSLVMLGLMTA